MKFTNEMLKIHRNSNELIFISHPGWNSQIMSKTHNNYFEYISKNKNKLYLLREEIMIKQLLFKANKINIPVILSIPSYINKENNNINNNKITFIENQTNTYQAYLKKLINNYENIYLLPSQSNSGIILSNSNEILDIRKFAQKVIKSYVKINLKGKILSISFDQSHTATNSAFNPDNFKLEKILSNTISEEENNLLISKYGEEIINKINSKYSKEIKKYTQDWKNYLNTDMLASPLLKPILTSKWDSIYFAGGEISGCLKSSMQYFNLITNPNLIFLSQYSFPNIETYKIIKKVSKIKLSQDFPLSQNYNETEKILFDKLKGTLDLEIIEKEENEVLSSFMLLNTLINPNSKPTLHLSSNYF